MSSKSTGDLMGNTCAIHLSAVVAQLIRKDCTACKGGCLGKCEEGLFEYFQFDPGGIL